MSTPFYPSDSLFFSKILKKEIKANDLFLCQLKKEELNYDSVITYLNNHKLLREFSRPYQKPNPLYYSQMNFNSNKMIIHFEEGSKKIRLKSITINNDSIPVIEQIKKLKSNKCN